MAGLVRRQEAERSADDVGLVDEEAVSDLRDLRSLLGAVSIARYTA